MEVAAPKSNGPDRWFHITYFAIWCMSSQMRNGILIQILKTCESSWAKPPTPSRSFQRRSFLLPKMSCSANMRKHSANDFLVGLEQSRRTDSFDLIWVPKKEVRYFWIFLTLFSDHKWVMMMGWLNRFEPSILVPRFLAVSSLLEVTWEMRQNPHILSDHP